MLMSDHLGIWHPKMETIHFTPDLMEEDANLIYCDSNPSDQVGIILEYLSRQFSIPSYPGGSVLPVKEADREH